MNTRSFRPFRPRNLQGFTLIELLTVIAIIAILAAILIPSISKVRAQSNKAKSLSNLRYLQVANSLYATANNGQYVAPSIKKRDKPGGALKLQSWHSDPEYLELLRGAAPAGAERSVLRDYPEDLLDPVSLQSGSPNAERVVGSYGAFAKNPNNGAYWGDAHNSANHSLKLEDPSKSAAFATAVDWRIVYGGRFSWSGVEKKLGGAIAYRHLNSALIVYFDGHVGEVTKEDIRAIDANGGANNRFWKGQD